MPNAVFIKSHPKTSSFVFGALFLFAYWLFAFDGITFSDDVYYLLAGKSFWQGTMQFDSYHFSTRWGAYIPSGFIGMILGFDPHRISLVSLISYLGTLALLLKVLPKNSNPWVFVIWFSTQVYFLHFLTKVYPDSLLVFWTVLVPFSAVYRNKKPFLAAFGVISGLFFGFLTKETIVFLAVLPPLLLVWDWRSKNIEVKFYAWLLALGIAFATIYLGYFWIEFGSPFYRFISIQEGHYISEFTYADKSGWDMLKRLTILPILTFVERSYWLWLVFAIPAFARLRKNPSSPGIEFAFAFLSLLLGFWFMSTNFKFYNPLYLNPRHLIVLVPILAFLINLGWEEWQNNPKLRWWMIVLIHFGIVVSLVQLDWLMVGFQFCALLLTLPKTFPYRNLAFGILLLAPAMAAPIFHHKTKNYRHMIETFEKESDISGTQQLILTHSFIDFSKQVLFPENQAIQSQIFPIEKLDSLKRLDPQQFKLVVYDFYQKAYPNEQQDLDALEPWLESNYNLIREEKEGLIGVKIFRKK